MHRDYMQSKHWDIIRSCVLARDGDKCVRCGRSDAILQAHHKHYPKNIWDTTTEDCETLCIGCHKKHHKDNAKVKLVSWPNHVARIKDLSPPFSKADLDLLKSASRFADRATADNARCLINLNRRSTAQLATSDQGNRVRGQSQPHPSTSENNANPGNGATKLASGEGVKVSGSTVAQAKHQQSPAPSKASVPLVSDDRPACGLTHNAAQDSLRVFQPPADGQNHPLLAESVIGDLDMTAGAVP